MAVHVNDGVFQLHNAHCSLEMSAGRGEGGWWVISSVLPWRQGGEGLIPSLAPCCSFNPGLVLLSASQNFSRGEWQLLNW